MIAMPNPMQAEPTQHTIRYVGKEFDSGKGLLMRVRFVLAIVFSLLSIPLVRVQACGGLFCQNVPVDQQAERIIFTVNADDTITAYVQINYTGSAPDFSWVVPVPSVPELDVAEIESFDELSLLTAPVFIPPTMPDCAPIPEMAMSSAVMEDGGGVDVLASGAVGPYNYDVITSPDPQAMISWLRDNDYRVEPAMEPLIAVYNEEGMVFLAMKLQPDEGADDIQPVVMTYDSTQPMIPLRLTAVAANPNMTVLTWIFAEEQAVPINYAHPVVYDADIRGSFGSFDGTNYLSLLDQTVDLYEGRAFVTEYAMPTSDLRDQQPQDTLVQLLTEKYKYVTRVIGRISPEEMTVDPMFTFDADAPDISNVRDLSQTDADVFWQCENAPFPEVEYDESVVPEGFK